MKRADDFEQRRQHIANLSDEELYNKFWDLTAQVVDPLLELGRKNTTPSIERSVLLGEIYRHNGEWKFSAKGQGVEGEITEVRNMYL